MKTRNSIASSLNSKNPSAERGRNKSLKPKKMGQSKIKTIQPNGTYDSQNGLMYKFEIELESGDSGEVSAKSESRWSVGDEVEFEVTPSKWGDKMRLTKPGFTPNQSKANNPDIQKRIDASWAIGHAINQESDPEKILEAAEFLLSIRSTLISKL
jgi:hypothetical protein